MNNNFDYESVPDHYTHCFNEQCDRSEKCMRRFAAQHSNSSRPVIRVISPVCFPEDVNTCSYFHPIRKIRMAWGVKKLLDNVPSKDAKALKAQIISYFGRTHYYRVYRKEHGITPEQQTVVRHLLHSKGILGEPAFDSYSEVYKWD